MKSNRFFLQLVLVLVLFAILELPGIVAAAQDTDLALIHEDQNTSWYINTSTMVKPVPGTVSFWSKIVPSRESRYFEQMELVLEKARKDPDRLEYVQVLQELKCGTNKTKVWNVVFYDRQDQIIYSSTASKPIGDLLALQQEAGSVRNAVCSTAYHKAPGKQDLVAELTIE
jgi:hypothetical protein